MSQAIYIFLMMSPTFHLVPSIKDLVGIETRPFLVLGNPETDDETSLFKPIDVALSRDGFIYILDTGEDHIKKFDFHGKLLKTIGRRGKGPGEFEQASDIGFVKGELWLADRGNGRITIFENDRYSRYFKPQGIAAPMSLAITGGKAFLCGIALHPRYGGVEIYDDKGRYQNTLGWAQFNSEGKSRMVPYWDTVTMVPVSRNRLMIGYKFDNKITVIDTQGKALLQKDMSGFYEKYEDRKGANPLPASYAAMAFSEGPGSTFLVSVCDDVERVCAEIYQFNETLTGLVGRRDMLVTTYRIRYFPELGFVVMINVNGEVQFYGTQ